VRREETARRTNDPLRRRTISGSLKRAAPHRICAARHIPFQADWAEIMGASFGSSDLRAAAESIAEGAFAFAGQRCTANRRAIVDSSVYDVLSIN